MVASSSMEDPCAPLERAEQCRPCTSARRPRVFTSEKWVLARLRRAFSCRVFRFKVVHINDTNNIEAKIGGSARKIGMQVSTTARVSKLKLGENRSGAVVLRGRFGRELRHHPGRRSGWAGRQAERQRLPTQGGRLLRVRKKCLRIAAMTVSRTTRLRHDGGRRRRRRRARVPGVLRTA